MAETRDAALGAGREVPGSASRGPRLRSRLDAQPGDAAPDQRHRVRRAALWAPRQLRHLRQCVAARGRRRSPPQSARPIRAVGLRASRATCRSSCCRSRTRPTSISCASLVQAHAYWRLKGLAVDLVIWNEDRGGYRQVAAGSDHGARLPPASKRTSSIARAASSCGARNRSSDEDRILLQSVARAIISDRRGSLVEQVTRRGPAEVRVPRLVPTRNHQRRDPTGSPRRARPDPVQRARRIHAATAASTSSRPARARRRRPPGSTCSPTRTSAPSYPRAASRTRGAENATSSVSRRGTTTP